MTLLVPGINRLCPVNALHMGLSGATFSKSLVTNHTFESSNLVMYGFNMASEHGFSVGTRVTFVTDRAF